MIEPSPYISGLYSWVEDQKQAREVRKGVGEIWERTNKLRGLCEAPLLNQGVHRTPWNRQRLQFVPVAA